jgi:hypothetical protein
MLALFHFAVGPQCKKLFRLSVEIFRCLKKTASRELTFDTKTPEETRGCAARNIFYYLISPFFKNHDESEIDVKHFCTLIRKPLE